MQRVLGEEILRKAIQGEIQAMEFYSKVSKIIINKKSKSLMQNLANEEEKHKNILQKRYNFLYKKDFEEIPDFIFDKNSSYLSSVKISETFVLLNLFPNQFSEKIDSTSFILL